MNVFSNFVRRQSSVVRCCFLSISYSIIKKIIDNKTTGNGRLTTDKMFLSELHIGSKLLLRCKTDWRDATVVVIKEERITLLVCSPTGYSYKVRKEPDEELDFHGEIPLLGEGNWKEEIARYDVRW